MMELSLQEDVVENNDNRSFDEIKVEGEILTWDTLWFEVCSSGEQNEDNKETVNTCHETVSSETTSSDQVVHSTPIKNEDASDSALKNIYADHNIGIKSNEVFTVATKSVISEISDATTEVKRRTCTVRDEATESQLTNKGCATSKDFSESDDTSVSDLNICNDQHINSKGNDVFAVTTKSASSEKPEQPKDDDIAEPEVQRRTISVTVDAARSPQSIKGCSTSQNTSRRTCKQTVNTENQIIPNKESKKNNKVSVLDKEAQSKTSQTNNKYIQNVNKHDIKSLRKSERRNVEKMFDSTEWDTSTSHMKKTTQTIEKPTVITEIQHLKERNKEQQKDTSQNGPCNELPDSQSGITDKDVHDLLGEIEINIPYQLTEDQFNKIKSTTSNSEHLEDAQIQKTFRLSNDQCNDLNFVTTNNNASGQSDVHVDFENFRSSVLNSGSNSQQVETSYDYNDRSCQSTRSLYGRNDSANVTPQIKERYVVDLKYTQYGRTASATCAKTIDINQQIKECNDVLKDTQFGRTDSAKTIIDNPQIKECYVVLEDIRNGNELTENTANIQSTALTKKIVVNACNDFNGDEESHESLNSLRANDKEAKYNKVSKVKKSFNLRTEVKIQKQKGNICKGQQLNKLENQKLRFPWEKKFKHTCNVCNKKFKKSHSLRNHTKKFHEIPKTQRPKTTHWCFPCGKEFDLKSRLKSHQKMHSDVRPYSCNVCCKKFKKSQHLKEHMPIHTRVGTNLQKLENTHWCFPCGKEYKRMSRLKNHQKMHSDERPYSCCICSKKYKRMSHLRRHRRIHTGETPYTCEFCDKKFKYQSSLYLHMPIHKNIAERKPFLCSFCGKYFSAMSNFQIHKLSHQTERRQTRKGCQESGKNVDAIRMNDQSIDNQIEFSDTNVLDENFKCSECNAMFEDKNTLKLHEETHVPVTCLKTLNCVFCAEEFILERHLIKHLYIHIRENYYHNNSRTEVKIQKQKGNICKGQQLMKLENQKFRFSFEKEFKYSCDVCYKKFTKSQALRNHTKKFHEIPKTQRPKTTHWCFPCGKEFELKSSLKKHQRKHTDERPYSCNICCKSFKCPQSLDRHNIIHSSNTTLIQKQKTSHWCFPCGKEFKRMSRLKSHQKMHSDVRPYSCNVCCKKFKKSQHLQQHMPIHTRVRTKVQKPKNTHWCFPCGKEYKRMSRLKNHQKMHSDERPYSCCLCSKKFKRISHLRMHRRIHTGETPYTCELCDKKFKYQSSLYLHMPIHKNITEREPFLCSFCGKYFSATSNFQIHELSHLTERRQTRKGCQESGKNVDAIRMNDQSIDNKIEFSDTNFLDENFKCSECDAMFEDKNTLKLHGETHVRVTCLKTLNCVFCAEEFILEKHLIKHLYIHIRENYYHNNVSKKDEQKRNIYKKRDSEHNNGGIKMFEVNSNKEYSLNSNEKYTCCQCDEQFCSPALLKTHELTHTMPGPSKSYSNKWKFNCSECNAGFNLMSKLKIHESSHAGVKIHHCDLCGQNFRNKSTLKLHNQIHTGENYFNCDQCDRIFKKASKLQAHRQKDHTGEKPLKCSVCFKRFCLKSSLNRHMKHSCSQTKVSNDMQCNKDLKLETENSKKQSPLSSNVWMNKETAPKKIERFVCEQCGTGFHYMTQYKQHSVMHSDVKPFSCDVCDRSFSRARHLKIHKRIHTGEKPYKCKSCDQTFSSSTLLIFHRRTHTGEKPYLCHVCGLQFVTGSGLSDHLLRHQNIKEHKCQICCREYKSMRGWKKHTETHNKHYKGHEGDKIKCETCRKEFKSKNGLQSHRRYVHSGNKPFSCLICQKRFVKSQNLKSHVRMHTGEKPYECSVCQKKYGSQKSHRDHLHVHSGETPYICDTCGKGFSQSTSCKLHQKTHTSFKQYVCEQCGKEFTFKYNYEKHMITHTNERPFTCKVCNKGFTQSSSLNTHYRLHEKELNSKKHEEKELDESLSSESKKAKLAHGKVKEINQRSTSSINSLSSSGVAAKASNFKTAPKQTTRSEGPYFPCSTCGKVFTQKYSLNWHQQTHYEKKQFKCDVCGKEFNFKGNLKTHIRVHTNEKPYKCHECGKGFSQSSSLHTHSRLHDKSETLQ
ncbi:zinc finger protein 208-like [Mytilus edulis]|uniref:zinc finger protein 208-like n=1 Tax=Mytilus edulis TaxID=6550 RepID=UPI0039EEAC01